MINLFKKSLQMSEADLRKSFNEIFASKEEKIKIELQGIDKVYDNGIKAIHNLNLTIDPGEFLVFLGPSGCGKTTALRMIAGLEPVSDGHLKFNGAIINDVPPKNRNIAMVFQNYALYPFMSVYKNIAFGLKNKARHNSAYEQATEKMRIALNSNYLPIKAKKAEMSLIKKGNIELKDRLLSLNREIKIAKIQKDYQILNEHQKERAKIQLQISKYKNSEELKQDVLKIKDEIRNLKKTKNVEQKAIYEQKKVIVDELNKKLLVLKTDPKVKEENIVLKQKMDLALNKLNSEKLLTLNKLNEEFNNLRSKNANLLIKFRKENKSKMDILTKDFKRNNTNLKLEVKKFKIQTKEHLMTQLKNVVNDPFEVKTLKFNAKEKNVTFVQKSRDKINNLRSQYQEEIKALKTELFNFKSSRNKENNDLWRKIKTLKSNKLDELKIRKQFEEDNKIINLQNQIYALKSELLTPFKRYVQLFLERERLVSLWHNATPFRINDVTTMLGIQMYSKRKPAELSGGQRQRVALARAISKRTNIFMYDEPLSNLDAKLRAKMRTEIREIHDKLGATSIYVTHDQIEAMSMADKIVVMHKGYIQQVGKPMELINRPANLFVAKFIGNTDINILESTYEGASSFKVGKAHIAMTNSTEFKNANLEKGAPIFVAFRPEHIIVDPFLVSEATENKFKGKIVRTELLGNEVLLQVEAPNLGKISLIAPSSAGIKIGESIDFAIDPNKVNVFDKEYGYNLIFKYDKENAIAKTVWIEGEIERQKNVKLLHYQKNRLKLKELVSTSIFSLFSNNAKEKLKAHHSKPVIQSDKIAK